MSDKVQPNPNIVWRAQRGQYLPFMVPLIVKELLMHGPRGSGKSDIMLWGFAKNVGKGWGSNWRGFIFKRTNPETEPLFEKTRILFQAVWPDIKYTTHPYKVFRWKTGEMLTIRHMFDSEDYNAVHGSEVGFLGYDELTNWPTPEVYLKSMSLLRSAHPEVSQHLRVWSTTNPTGPGHCVPYGEVLTADRGWVNITDVKSGDYVITVDAAGTAKRGLVSDIVQEHYEGDIISRKGRGICMEFTPNHRLPLVNTAGTCFTLRPFTDLPGQALIKTTADDWEAEELDSFTVPAIEGNKRVRFVQPDTLTGEDYAELMGWFLSEGCTVPRDKAFQIAQMKENNRAQIEELLTRCGFRFHPSTQGYTIYSEKWYQYLKQFGKCRDKFIPQNLKTAGRKTLQILLDALMKGDGSNSVYYTTSARLKDDVSEIAVKLGNRVYVSSRQRKNRVGLSYQINISKGKPTELCTGNHLYNVSTKNNSVNVNRIPFKGMVYCLTVPKTETFFIRQNGYVWLSGNSWVARRFNLKERGNDKKIIYDKIEDNPEMAKWVDDPLVNVQSRPRMSIFIDVRLNEIFMKANPTYLADLVAQAPNDAVRRAWVDGDWTVVAGGMFDDVYDEKIHVVKPFRIPLSWRIDRALDWGNASPFCVLWFAKSDGSDYQDGDGNWQSSVPGDLFVIREWYGTNGQPNQGLKLTASAVARGIVEREIEWGIHERVVPGPADSQIDTELNAGFNIQSCMNEEIRLRDGTVIDGVQWAESDKAAGARKTGWNMIRNRLKHAVPDPNHPFPREKPSIFFFRILEHTLQHFPNTPRDEKDVDDVPKRGEYHIQDTLRYRVLADGREVTEGPTVGKY